MPEQIKADRRLLVTADRSRVVEEGDPAGSWLLYAVGRPIGEGDVERYGLGVDELGRVTYDGAPDLPVPTADLSTPRASDDSDRNKTTRTEWTQRSSPEAYLRRYPTGPSAELARAVIAEAGADGGP